MFLVVTGQYASLDNQGLTKKKEPVWSSRSVGDKGHTNTQTYKHTNKREKYMYRKN